MRRRARGRAGLALDRAVGAHRRALAAPVDFATRRQPAACASRRPRFGATAAGAARRPGRPGTTQPQALDAGAAARARACACTGRRMPGCCPAKGRSTPCRRCRPWPKGRRAQARTWRWSRTRCASSMRGCIDDERFDWVFDVRGTGARPDLPVRGVRGEILWLHAPGVAIAAPAAPAASAPARLPRAAAGRHRRRRRQRDRVARTARRSRCARMLGLLSAAHSVVPELAEARIVHTETNLRPALPDNLPRVESAAGPHAHQRPVPPRLADRAGAGGGRAAQRTDRPARMEIIGMNDAIDRRHRQRRAARAAGGHHARRARRRCSATAPTGVATAVNGEFVARDSALAAACCKPATASSASNPSSEVEMALIDSFMLADVPLQSRFLLGTAGYPSPQVLRDAIAASGSAGGHARAQAPARRSRRRQRLHRDHPRERRAPAAQHRRLPHRARGRHAGAHGARAARHALDQARSGGRRAHAAARSVRAGRSRRRSS